MRRLPGATKIDPMHTTSASLLERLRSTKEDRDWSRFVDLYTPLLMYWARRTGLQTQDAADLVQDVFVTLVNKLPEFTYDKSKGFRRWLRTIIMNKWRDRQRAMAARPTGGAEGLSGVSSPEEAEALWSAEERANLVRQALKVMQTEFEPTTWQACWNMVVDGKKPKDVARELGLSENAVSIAKYRVLRKLRQEMEGFLR